MLAGLVAGFAASGQVTAVSAQGYQTRAPDPNTPRIMVAALKSSGGDKNLGANAAEAIRSRLSTDIPFKQLWVIPKNDIHATLAELRGKGAEVAREVSDQGWGLLAAIRLPDGSEFPIYQPQHPSPLQP